MKYKNSQGNWVDLAIQGTDGTPIGTISVFSGAIPPAGYLICDGSAISRTTYSELFSIIGTTYGSGDGSTTFNLPNLKGRVVAGQDSSQTEFDTIGETGGEKTITYTPSGTNINGAVKSHVLTTNEIPAHTHGSKSLTGTIQSVLMDDGKAIEFNGIASGSLARQRSWSGAEGSASYTVNLNASHTHNSVGSGQGHSHDLTQPTFKGTASNINNLQPYITLNYIIKVQQTIPLSTVAEIINTHSTSSTNGYSANYINDNYAPKVTILYNNNSGSNGSIQLDGYIENYDVIKVYFKISDDIITGYDNRLGNFVADLKVGTSLMSNSMELFGMIYEQGTFMIAYKSIHLESNICEPVDSMWHTINTGGQNTDDLVYITRIEGWKF